MRIPQAPAEKKPFFPLSPDTEISPHAKNPPPLQPIFFSLFWGVHFGFTATSPLCARVDTAALVMYTPVTWPLPLPLTSLLYCHVILAASTNLPPLLCRRICSTVGGPGPSVSRLTAAQPFPVPSVVTELCPPSRHQRRYESCDCTTLKPQSHTR